MTLTAMGKTEDCMADCVATYDRDEQVALSAAPAHDSEFLGWSGAGCGGTAPCILGMSEARAVTASFKKRMHLVQVGIEGTGAGSVLSSPSGIVCGLSCSAKFEHGAELLLTPHADVENDFVGWSGQGCAGKTSCSLVLTGPTQLSARFMAPWTRSFDGPQGGGDGSFSVTADSDGNVIAAGYMSVEGQAWDVWIRKYAADGSVLWTKTHARADNTVEWARAAAVDADNNVVILGVESISATYDRFWLRKFSREGAVLWTVRDFGGQVGGEDSAEGVATDSLGNVYVVGSVFDGTGHQDIWIRKFGADGTELWTRTHNGLGDYQDVGKAIAVDPFDDVVVVGSEFDGRTFNIWIRKLDPEGNALWTRTHEGTNGYSDEARGVAVDSFGNVVVVGHVGSATGTDFWIRKYSTHGSVLWTKLVEREEGSDRAAGVAVDRLGNIFVVGGIFVPFLKKYDPFGDELWTREYVGPYGGQASINAVAAALDGCVIVGSESYPSKDSDIFVRKYYQ